MPEIFFPREERRERKKRWEKTSGSCLILIDRCVVISRLLIDLVTLIDTYRGKIVRFASPATKGFISPLLSPSLLSLLPSQPKKTSRTRVPVGLRRRKISSVQLSGKTISVRSQALFKQRPI